jgi:phasin
MDAPKLEVPAELRNMVEKTIEQAEKAFAMFLDAANKSVAAISHPTAEMSKKALSFTEQNMKAAFDHAKTMVQATDLQKAMQIQSEFLRNQLNNVGEHVKKITEEVTAAARNASKGK